MPMFRCDFEVKTDLVLPHEANSVEINTPENYSIRLLNGETDQNGDVIRLVATVVGSSVSIMDAQATLREKLAEQLDLLSFATHSRFEIIAPIRLIEWEEWQIKREMRVFYTTDARQPPSPDLEEYFCKTVQLLEKSGIPAFTRRALKYFRYGLIDNQPEDQFMQLWLSLEIIAENTKERSSIPITCQVCGGSMVCSSCGSSPQRVPMAKQAIESIISTIAGNYAKDVARRQFKARNGLMHGRSTESIEAECKAKLPDIVDELGKLTWHAIMSTIPYDGVEELTFGHRDDEFTNKKLIFSAHIEFTHNGETPHPTDKEIPNPVISMKTNFNHQE
ncbi:hypothetical protein [Azospirillum argentinense]|uniref:hypothetical protein n=1 Tax=Azospirillum argentinense TaxID=2970906 RepID=UPI0010C05AC5|nr:hypothetical protein [Azospirillum argentinense]